MNRPIGQVFRACMNIRKCRVAGDFSAGQGGRAATIPAAGLNSGAHTPLDPLGAACWQYRSMERDSLRKAKPDRGTRGELGQQSNPL